MLNNLMEKQDSFIKHNEDSPMLKIHLLTDWIVQVIGSWKFIVVQTVLLNLWTLLNVLAWFEHWDPYPFIFLNLALSLQSAYAAPIIMMSQNRQLMRDRIEATNDALINKKAEKEIQHIIKQLETQDEKINLLHKILSAEKTIR